MKSKAIRYYMDIAKRSALESYATRLQVGACAVKGTRIISTSWNGTPSGTDNTCEYVDADGKLKTKDEVLHAEENLILKAAADGESTAGAVLYITHSPCIHCARMIYGAKFSHVVYDADYRSPDGINFLKHVGVKVDKFSDLVDVDKKPDTRSFNRISDLLPNNPIDFSLDDSPKILIATEMPKEDSIEAKILQAIGMNAIKIENKNYPNTQKHLTHKNWNLLFDDEHTEFYYYCLWKGHLNFNSKLLDDYNSQKNIEDFKHFCASRFREKYTIDSNITWTRITDEETKKVLEFKLRIGVIDVTLHGDVYEHTTRTLSDGISVSLISYSDLKFKLIDNQKSTNFDYKLDTKNKTFSQMLDDFIILLIERFL